MEVSFRHCIAARRGGRIVSISGTIGYSKVSDTLTYKWFSYHMEIVGLL